jgi:hypothetical protein
MSAAPTLAERESTLQTLHQNLWERIARPGSLTGEQVMAALLSQLVQQNADILAALKGGSMQVSSVSPGGLGNVVLTVSFPLAPSETNNLIAATPSLSGYRAGAAIQFPTLVSAGSDATVTIPPPAGQVLGMLGLFSISSTAEGAGVKITAFQDGLPLVGTQGFALGPAVAFPVPGYVVTTGLEIVMTNPSSQDVTVWMGGVALTVTRQFYDDILTKLQDQAWNMVLNAFGLVLPS